MPTGLEEAKIIEYIIEGMKLVAEQAQKRISAAQAMIQDDVRACGEYLHAAMDAIYGLENARLQLLNEAKWLHIRDNEKVARDSIAMTIDEFFRQRRLLPRLQDAIVGINGRVASLQAEVRRFPRRYFPSAKRQQEVVDIIKVEINALVEYMNHLKDSVEFQETAPEIGQLRVLQRNLQDEKVSTVDIRAYAVEEINRSTALDDWRHRVMVFMNDLRIAFRKQYF